MIESLDMTGIWRSWNPESKKYTWVSGKKPQKMARLDLFLATTDIYAKIIGCDIRHGYRSDHSLIEIERDSQEIIRGKGFWKLNNSLLRDPDYIITVKKTIEEVKEGLKQKQYNKQMAMEMVKLMVRGVTIPYCGTKKRLESKKRKQHYTYYWSIGNTATIKSLV